MRTECKCHGLSGSCTLRTCWRKLPLFRDVATRLKEKFDGAAKVIPGKSSSFFKLMIMRMMFFKIIQFSFGKWKFVKYSFGKWKGNDGKTIIPEVASIKPPGREDLIYSEESPDFCNPDRVTGSLGTAGRVCNSTSPGVEGCELLCCGRGYETRTTKTRVNCHCRFKWCCEVTCKICTVKKHVNTCRWYIIVDSKNGIIWTLSQNSRETQNKWPWDEFPKSPLPTHLKFLNCIVFDFLF